MAKTWSVRVEAYRLDSRPSTQTGQMIIWIKRTDGSSRQAGDPGAKNSHRGKLQDLLELACQPEMINSKFVEKYEKAGRQGKISSPRSRG